jgi:peptidyl-prolyl cis-trans isomerase C
MSRRLVGMMLTLGLLGCGWDRPGLAADQLLPQSEGAKPTQVRLQSPPAPPTETVQPVAAEVPPPSNNTLATVMARVNGQPILREEVYNSASWRLEELRPRVPAAQWPSVEQEVIKGELEQIIDRELLLQDATNRVRPKVMEKVADSASKEFDGLLKKQKGQLQLRSDEELRAHLEKRGNSVEEMRRQHIRAYTAMEYVRSLIRDKIDQISRQDLLDYYHENPKEFDKPERVLWHHIFIDRYIFSSEEEAKQVVEAAYAKAKGMTTEQFAAYAEDPNVNRSPSRLRKGEGEGTERGQIRPADVEETLFKLNSNELGPIIETPTGFHIVRVAEHVQGGKISFERACTDVRKKLQSKMGQVEYKRIVEELRAKAHIENSLGK